MLGWIFIVVIWLVPLNILAGIVIVALDAWKYRKTAYSGSELGKVDNQIYQNEQLLMALTSLRKVDLNHADI